MCSNLLPEVHVNGALTRIHLSCDSVEFKLIFGKLLELAQLVAPRLLFCLINLGILRRVPETYCLGPDLWGLQDMHESKIWLIWRPVSLLFNSNLNLAVAHPPQSLCHLIRLYWYQGPIFVLFAQNYLHWSKRSNFGWGTDLGAPYRAI